MYLEAPITYSYTCITDSSFHDFFCYYNCRVDNFLTIKIADFGLAKDVYTTEYYRVDKHAILPVKWMAIESLLDGYFDGKTDVVRIYYAIC